VVDELEYLQSLDFHQVNLADDLFTANKAHCLAVCDEIIARGLDLQWTSFARVDTVSPDLLKRMKASGCTAVSFGVESGNAEMLKRIRKGINLEQVVAAVDMCNTAGVIPHASFILGLPGETPESLKDSVDFGERLKGMGVSHGFHLLAPFPGTVVREEIDRYDLTILSHEWSQYHANRAIVQTSTVTPAMLDEVVLGWEEKFDEWLGILDKKYKSGEVSKEEAWPLLKLEHTVLIYDLMMGRGLEENGTWPVSEHPSSEREMIRKLSRKLIGTVKFSQEKIVATLKYAYGQKYLRPVQQDDLIQWEWNSYL